MGSGSIDSSNEKQKNRGQIPVLPDISRNQDMTLYLDKVKGCQRNLLLTLEQMYSDPNIQIYH